MLPFKKVWDTITKPELIKRWQYGSDLLTNWEVGSDIKFRSEWEGKVFEQWGKVLEIKPAEFLKYCLFAPRPDLEDKPENYFIMKYALTNEMDKQYLKLYKKTTDPMQLQGEENPVLNSLKELAETD